jgi:hypothetical protein
MKKILSLVLSLSALSASVVARADESVCVLLNEQGDNIAFEASNTRLDDEYRTIARSASLQGVRFYLRAGHGVARLEAWSNGKLLANTFYSTGREPAETDNLRLAVYVGAKNQEIEAQCEGVDALL